MAKDDIFGAEGDQEFLSRQAPDDFDDFIVMNGHTDKKPEEASMANNDLLNNSDGTSNQNTMSNGKANENNKSKNNNNKSNDKNSNQKVNNNTAQSNGVANPALKEKAKEEMNQIINLRLKEEEAFKKEQRDIANQEIQEFYNNRKNIMKRVKNTTQSKPTDNKNDISSIDPVKSPWTRVLALAEPAAKTSENKTQSPSNSTTIEPQKLKQLIAELSAQEA